VALGLSVHAYLT